MAKVFGIKEAKAAGEFAKTKEQRLTVLAVVKMLGLPVILQGEVKSKVAKLEDTFKKVTGKAGKLKRKMKTLEGKAKTTVLQKYDIIETGKDWEVKV